MQIITLVTDGHGHVRVAATRAPDLFRRNIAAETGDAWLTWCGVAPPQIGARAFVERLQHAWRQAHLGDATYRISPDAAVRTVYCQLVVEWIKRVTRAAVRSFKRRVAWPRRRGRSAGRRACGIGTCHPPM
jgi:hypothetical protein